MDIKDICKRLRALKNKTAFSRASGVGRATLYRVMNERDSNPTLDVLEKIERQLDKEKTK
jgi:transcriptional regulator with XRE-family HTH domain